MQTENNREPQILGCSYDAGCKEEAIVELDGVRPDFDEELVELCSNIRIPVLPLEGIRHCFLVEAQAKDGSIFIHVFGT